MNLLKTVVDDLSSILKKNGIDEVIDMRISNLDNYDYQINNLVNIKITQTLSPLKKKYLIS